MARYTLIRDSDQAVVHIFAWDGDTSKWQPPAGHTARPSTPEDRVVVTLTPEETAEQTIRQQAEAALQTNRDFIAKATPSNVEVVAQVKALSQQNLRLIRLVLKRFDGTG